MSTDKRVIGFDISHHQGKMNWDIAIERGIKFAFIRAGSIDNYTGSCYTDLRFEENAKAASGRIPISYYWFFRPNHDAFKQADYFYNLIKDKVRNMPPVIDVEYDGGKHRYTITKSIWNFIERLKERLAINKVIIYTRASFWNPYVGDTGLAKASDLWIARYINSAEPWFGDKDPYKPIGWDTWTFWQYSADGNMMGRYYGASDSRSIDLDYFNGNENDLKIYTNGGNVQPAPPDEGTQPTPAEPIRMRVVVDKLNIRSCPSIYCKDLGDLKYGDEVTIYNVSGKDVWGEIAPGKWAAIKIDNKNYMEKVK